LVGLLTIAGITACGDKVTVPPAQTTLPAVDSVVHQVTVSPPAVTMNVGDKVTLAASVDAGAGVTVRTVTWSSSNTAVATVDANGTVTAVAAGNATVIAKSNANNAVQGAAAITVNGGPGQGALATVTISTINSTNCSTGVCSSVPANLAAVTGQLDVTLNVDPGAQKLSEVDLLLNCNAAGNFPASSDTIVAKQTLSSGNVAPVAEAASAPVTLSFNTAAFDSTTGARFRNGQCQLKAKAITTTGTTVASSAQQLTLANADVLAGSVTSTATQTDLNGLAWHGGSVTIKVIPVFFTAGRNVASVNITYEGKTTNVTTATAGAFSATFNDDNSGGTANSGDPLDIDGITDANSQNKIVISAIDNNGNSFQNAFVGGTNPCTVLCSQTSVSAGAPQNLFSATSPFRLDTQKPLAGSLAVKNNTLQNTGSTGFVNGSFRFVADSAAGFIGPNAGTLLANGPACAGNNGTTNPVTCNFDNGGVDKVTVTFQAAPAGTSKTSTSWKNVTSPTGINDTNTGTGEIFRMLTADVLGNTDTSATTSFGVDTSIPSSVFTSGTADSSTFKTAATPGGFFFTISDAGSGLGTFAGGNSILVAQSRQTGASTSSSTLSNFENKVYSNNANAARPGETLVLGYIPTDGSPCLIGRFNAGGAGTSTFGQFNVPVFAANGTQVGACTAVPFTPLPSPTGVEIPSGNAIGLIRTIVAPTDQAGNVGTIFRASIYVDGQAPVIQNVDMPGTIAGNATVAFPVGVTDSLPASGTSGTSVNAAGDITSAIARVNYSAGGSNNVPASGPTGGITLQYTPDSSMGKPFDNVLTRLLTATNPSVSNFIKTLFVSAGGNTPPSATASPNAASISFFASDAANNWSTGVTEPLSTAQGAIPTQITGTNTVFSSSTVTRTFTGGFDATISPSTISNCPKAGCTGGAAPSAATATTITATASGATGTFVNPFSVVQVWYRAQGTTDAFVFAGNAVAGNPIEGGGARTIQYTFTFDPPAVTPASPEAPTGRSLTVNAAGIDYIVIGINSNGDAVATPIHTIGIANP